MTRNRFIALLVAASIVLLAIWIGSNTYWDDVTVAMPPRGEALVNPFYAAQRFAERLGAKTTWDRMLTVPPPGATLVVSSWHWGLIRTRRAAVEQWVASGGRLVVDDSLIDPSGEFGAWSGITRTYPNPDSIGNLKPGDYSPCRSVRQESSGRPVPDGDDALSLCQVGFSWLETGTTPEWALRDEKGLQAVRVAIGRGSVTVINAAAPFRMRGLFQGDHGRVFVAATGLRRGDEVHFLSEDAHPSLLTLTWRHGGPAVTLGLALLAALLWRGAIRFGPLGPPTVAARRSLADQIRGTGRFALQHGSGQSLHAACVRALAESASRRVSRYTALPPEERLTALARLTGFDRTSLAGAIHHPGRRTAGELRRTLALLEAARRQILATHSRFEHGTH